MLTFEDCLALCDLTEKEISAIAEHEHIPDMVAIELGNYLVHTENGEWKITTMILNDIKNALNVGDTAHADELQDLLKQFVLTHPKMQEMIRQQTND